MRRARGERTRTESLSGPLRALRGWKRRICRSATASTLRAFWRFAVLPSVKTSLFPYETPVLTGLAKILGTPSHPSCRPCRTWDAVPWNRLAKSSSFDGLKSTLPIDLECERSAERSRQTTHSRPMPLSVTGQSRTNANRTTPVDSGVGEFDVLKWYRALRNVANEVWPGPTKPGCTRADFGGHLEGFKTLSGLRLGPEEMRIPPLRSAV